MQSPSAADQLGPRSPPSRSPVAVGCTPRGQAAAVLSPSKGRGWPWGHVPHLWDSPPLRPCGSPAGTSESRPAPLFTIYSQSEHEATARSLESPAPAPRAPSTALAFNIFLSFPLSPGSSQRGVTRARWNFILFLLKWPVNGQHLFPVWGQRVWG